MLPEPRFRVRWWIASSIAIRRSWHDGGRAQPNRSLARTGVRLSDLGCCGRRGNELLHRLSADRLQEPLHDRALPVAEGVWIDGGKAADDGERGELRLGREPAFDRCQIWIELRGHPDPRLVFPLCASVRAARLTGFDRHAERLRKVGGVGYRQLHL